MHTHIYFIFIVFHCDQRQVARVVHRQNYRSKLLTPPVPSDSDGGCITDHMSVSQHDSLSTNLVDDKGRASARLLPVHLPRHHVVGLGRGYKHLDDRIERNVPGFNLVVRDKVTREPSITGD